MVNETVIPGERCPPLTAEETTMADADPTSRPASRPDNRETENEDQRVDKAGQPPRPATEPSGAEGSSNSGETATDPATGEAND
jgi:hypothetical protein